MHFLHRERRVLGQIIHDKQLEFGGWGSCCLGKEETKEEMNRTLAPSEAEIALFCS